MADVDQMLRFDVLPCPFCGEQPRKSVHSGIVFIGCSTKNCPASNIGGIETDEIAALDRWNKRVV